MPVCDHCGEQCNPSFYCSYCGGTYCNNHRLPPSHNCINEASWRNRTSGFKNNNDSIGMKSTQPIKECFFCGVETSKISNCPLCGHDFCKIHELHQDHFRESDKTIDQQSDWIPTPNESASKRADTLYSWSIFLMVIISVVISYLIALLSSTMSWDSIIIGTIIKSILVFVLFAPIFFIQMKITGRMMDQMYSILFMIITILIIFFVPIYIEIHNPLFSPSNYEYWTFPSFPIGSGPHQGNYFDYIIYYFAQFFALCLGIGIAIGVASTPDYAIKTKKSKQDNIELSEVWYNKGVKFTESNEYEKALMAYNQALTFNDKDQDIWNNKCYVLTKLGKCDEAINAGNIAVKLAPNDPVLWETLRDAYIGCNNQEKADECQKNVLKLKVQK